MTRIVIVGGGTGGTVLANRLADRLGPDLRSGDVEVVVINDAPDQVYKPAYLYVPFGEATVEDARYPLVDLLDRHVDLVIDQVMAVDTDGKRVTLRDGTVLAYDQLVLATGSRLVPEEVPGLVEGGHHFYGPAGAERLRDALADFDEGHLVLSVIGVPHMCPAAPLEFVFMADQWLRERGRREDVDITYTYPIQRIHGIEAVAEWAAPLFEERDVHAETFFNADAVDPEAQVLHTMEGTELDYDLLVAIPPHAGSALVTEAGLGDGGWVAVDNRTLEAEHADDVFAIGDVADVPTSKAGSVAHYQAGVVADRVGSRVRGQVPTAEYDGKTMCFVESGTDEATFLEFSYDHAPTPRAPSKLVHWGKRAYNEAYWLTARGLL